ncbi:hypothetical protein OE88DRAFT_622699 [Heliocybe sulcata]|uniref:Uncharacterized protein n=1 Tax=Heliocybe sulcata TaxID=5364 RepID=A0A5C3NHB5_9AGAM|nr:hypothetical protein OE88DRAFT_622699 [Heliocybe sulcata]
MSNHAEGSGRVYRARKRCERVANGAGHLTGTRRVFSSKEVILLYAMAVRGTRCGYKHGGGRGVYVQGEAALTGPGGMYAQDGPGRGRMRGAQSEVWKEASRPPGMQCHFRNVWRCYPPTPCDIPGPQTVGLSTVRKQATGPAGRASSISIAEVSGGISSEAEKRSTSEGRLGSLLYRHQQFL